MSVRVGTILNIEYVYSGYSLAKQGFDLPAQSHASYKASALPPSHHGWIVILVFLLSFIFFPSSLLFICDFLSLFQLYGVIAPKKLKNASFLLFINGVPMLGYHHYNPWPRGKYSSTVHSYE